MVPTDITAPGGDVQDAGSEALIERTQVNHQGERMPILMLGALGVVFGDIGTSPIYAFREALTRSAGGGIADRMHVLGVLSLIIWTLTITVTVKYVLFVLRADNKGEGGTLSLMALARSRFAKKPIGILILGILGTGLFYGDAVITPAISVLSAVEGINIVTPKFSEFVVPITVTILITLFAVQKFGTARVANVFGPITLIWFIAIGLSGLVHILDAPDIMHALDPSHIVRFLVFAPSVSFVTIGAVFLAVTGAEALYADLGHFGRRPIVLVWLCLVFPCLLLNYFGQGAYVLAQGGKVGQPFFEMNEGWALIPMVVLATVATVIASQAVISGAYSMTSQAIHLHMLPRMSVRHTSAAQSGQIYIPRVNYLIGIVVVALVISFGSSSALANAYGISVTGTMVVTTILLFIVMRYYWRWNLSVVVGLTSLFLLIDISFFASNISKVFDGGWVSLLIAAIVVFLMATWILGSRALVRLTGKTEVPLEAFAANLARKPPVLVSGTAVFLTADSTRAPTALLHSLKHYKVLHERNVILSVQTAQSPRVPRDERVEITQINPLFWRLTMRFGYMERPHIPAALALCKKQGVDFDIMRTSFFLSRRTLKVGRRGALPPWMTRVYIALAGSSSDATEYFQIPTGRVVEIGTQVEI